MLLTEILISIAIMENSMKILQNTNNKNNNNNKKTHHIIGWSTTLGYVQKEIEINI